MDTGRPIQDPLVGQGINSRFVIRAVVIAERALLSSCNHTKTHQEGQHGDTDGQGPKARGPWTVADGPWSVIHVAPVCHPSPVG